MQTIERCAFVGAGNMGEALIKGLPASGFVGPDRIVASEPRQGQRQRHAERYGVRAVQSNREAVAEADVVALAVKPQILDQVLDEIRPAVDRERLVISIAAGKAISGIEARLGEKARVVRAMPNVACLVGAGGNGHGR